MPISDNKSGDVLKGTANEMIEEITGITCVYIPVTNVYESVQWYRNNLGCEPTSHNPVHPGMTQAILRFPDNQGNFQEAGLRSTVPALILITATQSAGSLGFVLDNGVHQPIVCFITPRIRDMYERFKANGVTMETDIERVTPGGPHLRFRDPDGNVLAIWQPN